MRVGLDLRSVTDGAERLRLAIEADRFGLWAVLLGGEPGTEVNGAVTIATQTDHLQLAVWVAPSAEHPLTIAEELSVLDHLSVRRMLAIIDGPEATDDPETTSDHVRRLLHGHIVNGVSLAPPPAQTAPTVWSPSDIVTLALTGDLDIDRAKIDEQRDAGTTAVFVTWPGPVAALARHLVTRAAGPEFPQVVADVADQIAPFD